MSASLRAARTDLRQALQLLANRIPRIAQNNSISNLLAGKVGDLRRRASSFWVHGLRCSRGSVLLTAATALAPPPPLLPVLNQQDPSKLLGVWHQLLVDPETCLPAAACLQGLLLRTVSSLVDAAIPAAAQASEADLRAISLALIRLLQFSDALER